MNKKLNSITNEQIINKIDELINILYKRKGIHAVIFAVSASNGHAHFWQKWKDYLEVLGLCSECRNEICQKMRDVECMNKFIDGLDI